MLKSWRSYFSPLTRALAGRGLGVLMGNGLGATAAIATDVFVEIAVGGNWGDGALVDSGDGATAIMGTAVGDSTNTILISGVFTVGAAAGRPGVLNMATTSASITPTTQAKRILKYGIAEKGG